MKALKELVDEFKAEAAEAATRANESSGHGVSLAIGRAEAMQECADKLSQALDEIQKPPF